MALFFRIEDILPEEIEEAKNFKGWLKKKSPNFLGGWQKRQIINRYQQIKWHINFRIDYNQGYIFNDEIAQNKLGYFVIASNGERSYSLAYFDNEKDPKPKGHIDISKIQDIHYDGDRIFSIIYPERNFDLKPKTSKLRAQWSRNLMIIKKWLQKKYPQNSTPLQPLTASARASITSPRKSWKTFSERSLSSICIQKDKVAGIDSNSGSESKSPDSARMSSKNNLEFEIDNAYLLQKSGLSDHINVESPKFQNRILCGFLQKRSRGKVKYFMKRWFVLISAKPLSNEYFDEEILQESELPPWMELDTLYQFTIESKENMGKPKKGLKMNDCIEIFDKDMSQSKEKGFTFSINMGDRLYHLMADTEVERRAWVAKLRTSIGTIKELNKGNIKIKKNIDVIIKEYDSHNSLLERRKKLRDKIDSDILKYKQQAIGRELEEGEKIENLDQLLKFLQLLSTEMLDVMNACLAKQPKREDIIKEYTDYLHEYACSQMTSYWEDKFQTFDGISLLKLSTWIAQYQEDLKKFINDDRIEHGLNTLLKIHTNRSIEAAESFIDGILEYERKNKLDDEASQAIKNSDILTSNTPVDLFKIINEGLDFSYAICSSPELGRQFGNYGSGLIRYYLEGVQNMIDELDLSINQLICICNNTILFSESSNKFYTRLSSLKGLKEEEVEKTFNKGLIAKQFLNLSNNAYNKIESYILQNLPTYFSRKNFLDLKLGEILTEFVESRIVSIKIFHDRFQRKAWKQILDQIILQYFQCMILSCPKAKKEQIDEFVEKLEDDQKLLQEEFSSFLFDQSLKNSMKPFAEMIDFITEDSEIKIQKNCRNLRICFGPAFTFKTVKTILELRKDLDKETRNDMIHFCQDTLQLYNKEHAQELEEQENNMRINVLGVEQMQRDSLPDTAISELEEENGIIKRKSISLNFTVNEGDLTEQDLNVAEAFQMRKDSLMSRRSTMEEQKPREFIEEGSLLKKRNDHNFYEKRYFRIRKGVLFWYLSERAQDVQNKIELSMVEEVKEKEAKFTFTLNLEDKKTGKKGKSYKFKAENLEEMTLWVKTLKREISKIQNHSLEEEIKFEAQKTGQGKAPLFKDYDAMRRVQRVKQKLEEKKRKQEEKDKQRKEEQQRALSLLKKEQKSLRQSVTKQPTIIELSKNNRTLEMGQTPNDDSYKSHGKIRVSTNNCWTKFLNIFGLTKTKH